MKFTVLLLYPDYLANDYPNETYRVWVEAETPKQAAAEARKQAIEAYINEYGKDNPPDPVDFAVIFLTPGHIFDYSEFHDKPIGE